MHDRAIREYGGPQGIKSKTLLGSALNRAPNRHQYAGPPRSDLFDLAACYAYGIAKNHPFNDGNKRSAWTCCVLFLKVNGVEVDVPAPMAVQQTVALVAGGLTEETFAAWLRTVARR